MGFNRQRKLTLFYNKKFFEYILDYAISIKGILAKMKEGAENVHTKLQAKAESVGLRQNDMNKGLFCFSIMFRLITKMVCNIFKFQIIMKIQIKSSKSEIKMRVQPLWK